MVIRKIKFTLTHYAVFLLILIIVGLAATIPQKTERTENPVRSDDYYKDRITATLIEADCPDCTTGRDALEPFVDAVRWLEPRYAAKEEKDELIARYGIEKLPAIIFSDNIMDVEGLESFLSERSTHVKDKVILTVIEPPYYSIPDERVVGWVDATYIQASPCGQCYDARQHKVALVNQFGLKIRAERVLESSSDEAKAIIRQYGIKSLPTVLLSPDAIQYPKLADMWLQVGSIEEDGTLVFRNQTVLYNQTWYDMEKEMEIKK